jgi:hypothetical protein
MKSKMPAFLSKKKRDPKSTAPAKNTKGASVTKAKSKKQDDKEQDRGNGGDRVPAQPMGNKADNWLAAQAKPKNRKGY